MKAVMEIDLLRLEMETLWGQDLFGRADRPHPLVAVAVAKDGLAVSFNQSLPPDLRSTEAEKDLLFRLPGTGYPDFTVYSRLGPTIVCGGPSFIFDENQLPAVA